MERAKLLLASLKQRPWVQELFTRQQRVIQSRARRKAIRCSRRAGKTVTAGAGLAEALEDADFDEAVVYAARTRGIAKRLIWGKLRRIARDHKRSGWEFSEAELTITNERGGFIIVVGLDKPAEIEKLRGLKIRRFVGDEPATYASLLGELYDEILEPACADLDGDIWLMGTPGPILKGFWYEASRDRRDDEEPSEWELHHWTMFDNPHMKDPIGFLERVMNRKGWSKDNPVVLREYYGLWTSDDDAQVYRYMSSRNDVYAVPGYSLETRSQWVHTLGIDYGMVDACAWVVIASHQHQNEIFAIRAFEKTGLLPEKAADITRSLVAEFDPYVLVGDAGGLGKPYVEAYNQRHLHDATGEAKSIAMIAAEKTEKRAHIELMNGDIRSGRFKLLIPDCAVLAKQMEHLPWADDRREKEHPAYDQHACDAALYAFRHHRSFMHKAPVTPVHTPLTPDTQAWRDLEIAQMSKKWWQR